jgi:NADP-dependent 3-hydroxy acid dehydrogenase YdfG
MTTPTNTTPRPLSGRVAVVTGASSGIGEATAKRLAASGAKVAVLARRADRLEKLVDEIVGAGGTALAIPVDVTDAEALNAAADRVAAEFGTVDLLFNNAGVMLPAPVEEVASDQWRQQIDLNVTGLMNAIGAFVPQLIKAAADTGVADLVNTSSIAAQNIFPNFSVYSGTKAFVTHLSRTLRAELGAKDVRVSVIEPGIVETELQGHVTDPGAQAWLDNARQQITWLASDDVAEAINFLVSQPARVNFQQLTIMPTRQAS